MAATKKAAATKKQASSKGSTEEESPDAKLPKKLATKKGKRGKTTVFDTSSEESGSEMISSKKPATAKGKTVKVRERTYLHCQVVRIFGQVSWVGQSVWLSNRISETQCSRFLIIKT